MRSDLHFLSGSSFRSRALHRNVTLAGALGALALGFLAVGSSDAATLHCTGGDGTQLVTVDQSNGAVVVIGPSASGSYAALGRAFDLARAYMASRKRSVAGPRVTTMCQGWQLHHDGVH